MTGSLEIVRCPVCGRGPEGRRVLVPAAEVRAQQDWLREFHRARLKDKSDAALFDRGVFTQSYATDIVACEGCGLVMRNPRPAPGEIEDAYAHDRYGDHRLRALFDAHLALYRPRAAKIARLLHDGPLHERPLHERPLHERPVDEPRSSGGARRPAPRVLEVGSFVGGFLAAAKERGLEALGVDPGEEVDRFCGAHGLRVLRGTIDDLPVSDRRAASWDAVAIWNTFDQLPEEEPVLAEARRLLRPGGVLALRVPNGACFRFFTALAKRVPRAIERAIRAVLAWNNLLAFPYLYGHSPRTLDALLARHGFARAAVDPDTLVPIADADTTLRARVEETALKAIERAVARALPMPRDRRPLAPWLDAYYRAV